MFASILVFALFSQVADSVLPKVVGMNIKLEKPIGSLNSVAGDTVALSLEKAVLVNGKSVLPKGTRISGKVIYVVRADGTGHTRPDVGVDLDTVTLPDGRSFGITSSTKERSITCDNNSFGSVFAASLFGQGAVAYNDFQWKQGHKTWCHLDFDLMIPVGFN